MNRFIEVTEKGAHNQEFPLLINVDRIVKVTPCRSGTGCAIHLDKGMIGETINVETDYYFLSARLKEFQNDD